MKDFAHLLVYPCLALLVLLVIGFFSSPHFIRQMGGAFSQQPEQLQEGLSPGAKALLKKTYEGIEPGRLRDYHVHVLGTGHSGTFVNSAMQSWFSPFQKLKFFIFSNAAGLQNTEKGDEEYILRLVRLIRNTDNPGKYHLLAFDKFYHREGKANLKKTAFYVPNDYVFKLSTQYPDIFIPIVSIHPYRQDALEALEKWAGQGAKYIKWLPNAMGIDPSDEKLHPFYEKMKKHQMILLTHTGEEQAVTSEAQYFGNPLRLRKPLGYGIRVIMAHSATLGDCADLRSPQSPKVPCFSLFLAMMRDPQYEGLLFGELSAVILYNRKPQYLRQLIAARDLHPRLVNGSDYPIPAVNFLVRTVELVKNGFLQPDEGRYLNEIYDYNPLLYDYVLKRTLRDQSSSQGFSPSIFMDHPKLD